MATSRVPTAVAVGTALVGAGLLLGARPLLRAMDDETTATVATTRVLGARYLVQAVVVAARPGTLGAAARVDVLHAASMVPLTARPTHRAPALVSAAVAAVVAAASWWAGRRETPSHRAPQHRTAD